MGLRAVRERAAAATVVRRYGAWLVSWEGGAYGVTDDATPGDLYDCASSLAVAKRVAVRGAREFGYEGAVRWTKTSDRQWTLEMTWPTDEWDGEE